MELVRGIPITDYCDQHQLGVRERLELFTHVCQAVQHAHQKGIIHRDLKPSNVMVTHARWQPVVKIIDFGIAKATGQQLTDKTLFTNFAQMIGTPMYMSPEQARDERPGRGHAQRRLLAGRVALRTDDRPHAVRQGAAARSRYDEMIRIIREEEPVQAEHADQHARQCREHRAHRSQQHAAKVEPVIARRVGLDRDEGAGEGPQPAL